MAGFKDFVDEQNLTEGTIKIHYEWDRPLDGSEKALSKKYGITIKVINQMHAEITGEKKKILNFLQHEDALIKSDPDMLDVLYSELVESKLKKFEISPTDKDLEMLFNKALGMFNLSLEIPSRNKISAAISSCNRRYFDSKYNLGGTGDKIDKLYKKFLGRNEDNISERLQILSDEKIDDFIEREWGKGQAYTYEYDIHAAAELAKVFPDVLVTKDMKYMHIPGTINMKQNAELNKIEAKYKLKDLQKTLHENKVFDYLGRLLNIKTTKGKPDYKDAPDWAEYLGKTPSGAYHWLSNKVNINDLNNKETYFDGANKIKFTGFVGNNDGKVSLEKIK